MPQMRFQVHPSLLISPGHYLLLLLMFGFFLMLVDSFFEPGFYDISLLDYQTLHLKKVSTDIVISHYVNVKEVSTDIAFFVYVREVSTDIALF